MLAVVAGAASEPGCHCPSDIVTSAPPLKSDRPLIAQAATGPWGPVPAPAARASTLADAPPAVTILCPVEGEPYSGIVLVEGTASDDVAVLWVEVRIDGGIWARANGTTRWSVLLDTYGFDVGEHVLEARASDGSGHSPVAKVNFSVERGEATVGGETAWPAVRIAVPVVLAVAIASVAVWRWRSRARYDGGW